MTFKVTSEPACEPIATEDAKLHLRVDLPDEDHLIDAAVMAARTYAENFMRRKLITQTVQFTMTGFCGPTVELPLAPIQSITSVQYVDSAGTLQTLDAADYQLVNSVFPARLAPAYGLTWPVVRADYDSVIITAVVGYGDDADTIPGDIMAALRLLLGHFYENRQNELAGTIVSKVTLSAERLMQPHVLYV